MAEINEWKYGTNVYEVNIRQYTTEGTFNAFATHLPRLRAMGVEILWLMPITPISKVKMKGSIGSPYACSDYCSVNAEFGTMEDFKNLIQSAHNVGLKVIIDWVANHTGWDHVWAKNFPEFYKKAEDSRFKTPEGMEDIIELDFTNQEMTIQMIDAMKFWVANTDIDGFRCDLADWVHYDFWYHAKKELELIKPNLFWLGEFDVMDSNHYMQTFDAAYTWKWMHKSRDFAEGKCGFDELLGLLHEYHIRQGIKMWFTTNHDENSWNGTEFEKYGQMVFPLTVFNFTWPGIPLVYSGQEIPNIKRLKFFDKDPIDWSQPLSMEKFYRMLYRLRFQNEALRNSRSATEILINSNQTLVYRRSVNQNEVIVALNFSNSCRKISLNIDKGLYYTMRDVNTAIEVAAECEVMLNPYDYKILLRK